MFFTAYTRLGPKSDFLARRIPRCARLFAVVTYVQVGRLKV
jgi:hypothetical protein